MAARNFMKMSEDEIIALARPQTDEEKEANRAAMDTAVARAKKFAMQESKTNSNLMPDENAVFVHHALDTFGAWNKTDLNKNSEVEKRVRDYFEACAENNMRPSPPGLANYMGIATQQLKTWLETGSVEASRVYTLLESTWADYMLQNKIYPATGIFLGKNWFNYRDVQKVEVMPQIKEEIDLDRLKAEAAALPDVDDIEDASVRPVDAP